MTEGLARVIGRLYREGRFDGILAMAGSGGTAIATQAMRALPVGVPKVMVSTVAAGDVGPYVGTRDIVMVPSVVDVADITTTELADEVCGGVLSAGPDRLFAAARVGVPAVLVPGCVDMANFWAPDTERYRSRNLYEWNPNVTLMRTSREENVRIGEWIGRAAAESTGPVSILLPLGGVSMLDAEGQPFWDPDADRACFEAIRQAAGPGAPVNELEHNINDDGFADALLDLVREAVPRR